MAPPDAAVREAMRTRLGETMFVEAGAGSGKTTCLVDRFVALVESGVDADRIAAITFTEKAAGELADRIRAELQKRSATSAALPCCAAGAGSGGHLHVARLRPASAQRSPDRSRAAPACHGPGRDRLAAGVRDALGSLRGPDHRRPRPGTAAAVAAGGRGPGRPSAPGGACSSGPTGTWWKSGSAAPTRRFRRSSSVLCSARSTPWWPWARQCRVSADHLLFRLDRLAEWAERPAGRGGRRQPVRTPVLGAQLLGGQRRQDRQLAQYQSGTGPGQGAGTCA